jgi:hypothetical protein
VEEAAAARRAMTTNVSNGDTNVNNGEVMSMSNSSSKKPFRSLSLVALLSLIAFGACTEEREPRSFVQPNAIRKADLEGTWHYLQTVTDAPPTSSAAFIGLSSDLMKIRFDIQEDTLYARRSHEQIDGSEDSKAKDQDAYQGAPLAAWRIESHFDIIREYNATTGEETNKIVESTERPWSQREFIRVDWSKNLTNNYAALGFNEGGVKVEAVSYWESDPNKPEAIHFERAGDKNPEFTKGEANYFDLTNKVVLTPEELTLCFDNNQCFRVPACWLSYQLDDCADSVIKMRHAFAKVSPKHEYEPRHWDGRQMDLFGLWDVGLKRLSYNRQYGVTNSGISRFAARFNLWADSYDEQGKPIPYADRPQRTIPYYASTSGAEFPKELFEQGREVIRQWNEAMEGALRAVTGKKDPSQKLKPVFVWCHNPVKLTDDADGPADAPECQADLVPELDEKGKEKKGKDGKPVYFARQGDPRRSVLFWVNQFQASGPLGYGPPMFDPQTGETISGQAYIYGAALDTYAARGRDLVKLVTGRIGVNNFVQGANVRDWVDAVRTGKAHEGKTLAPEEIQSLVKSMDYSWAEGLAAGVPLDTTSPKAFAESVARRKEAIWKTGVFGKGQADIGQIRRERARNTPIEAMMITPERLILGSRSPLKASWSSLSDAEKGRISPLRSEALARAIQERRERLGALGYDFADFMDEGVAQRALRIAKSGGSFDDATLLGELRKQLFLAVSLHELGHNVGLRHNFRASYDALNYHPEYWNQRVKGAQGESLKFAGLDEGGRAKAAPYTGTSCEKGKLYPRYVDCPGGALSVAEAEGAIREYQYSSVMDYGSDFNADLHGLGRYDRAAIKFGYAGDGYVEVFTQASTSNPSREKISSLQTFSGAYGYPSPMRLRRSSNRAMLLEAVPYTDYPSMFDGKPEAMSAREDVPFSEIELDEAADGLPLYVHKKAPGFRPMVPYYFCGDEFVGNLTCLRYDSGADPWEQASDMISRYENYYILNNFKRDRYTFYTSSGYVNNIAGRYLLPLRSHMTWLTLFKTIYADQQGAEQFFQDHEKGWGSFSVAVAEGFDLFGRILTRPEPGLYIDAKGPLAQQIGVQPGDFDFERVSENPYLELGPEDEKLVARVGLVDGKFSNTSWDGNCGYYAYDECQSRIGYILDKTIALEVLTESQAYFTGRDTSTDVRLYAIGYILPFKHQLLEKFGAILSNDVTSLSPAVGASRTMSKPRWSISDPSAARTGLIDPVTGFTVQIFSGVYGLTGFPSTFDQTYIDATRVFVIGNGEAPVPDSDLLPAAKAAPGVDPGPAVDATKNPMMLVSNGGPKNWFVWTDSFTGKSYAARSFARTGPATNVKYRIDVATRMLQKAQVLEERAKASCAAGAQVRQSVCEKHKREFEDFRQNIDIMRSLHNAFGYARYSADAPFFY